MREINELEMVAKACGRGLIPEDERNPYEPLGDLDPDFARAYWGEGLFLVISYQRHEEVRAEVGAAMERAASLPTFEERKEAYLGLPVMGSRLKVGSGVEGVIIDYADESQKGASSFWRLYLPREKTHLWVQNIAPSVPVKGAYKSIFGNYKNLNR